MTLEQAKDEASRRWGVHGGWAERELYTTTQGGERWICKVGIRVPAPVGNRKLCMGMAGNFSRAFQAADKFELRPARPRVKPEPHPLALPQTELWP